MIDNKSWNRLKSLKLYYQFWTFTRLRALSITQIWYKTVSYCKCSGKQTGNLITRISFPGDENLKTTATYINKIEYTINTHSAISTEYRFTNHTIYINHVKSTRNTNGTNNSYETSSIKNASNTKHTMILVGSLVLGVVFIAYVAVHIVDRQRKKTMNSLTQDRLIWDRKYDKNLVCSKRCIIAFLTLFRYIMTLKESGEGGRGLWESATHNLFLVLINKKNCNRIQQIYILICERVMTLRCKWFEIGDFNIQIMIKGWLWVTQVLWVGVRLRP